MNNCSKTTLAFLAGLAVGATVITLLTSDRGVEFRERFGDSVKRTGEDLKKKGEHMLSKITETIEKTKTRMADRAHEVIDDFDA